MKWVIVGLGNPGDEYERTRHNAGRLAVQSFAKKSAFSEWEESGKHQGFVSKEKVGKSEVVLLLPQTYMNKSGKAVETLVKSAKAAKQLVVVYDDIDLPLGKIKISFGRSSGGHNGVESIIKAVKTRDFVRVRIGVAPTTPSGKIKKPQGEKKVHDFLLGDFRKPEEEALQRIYNVVNEALSTIVEEGCERAMNRFN